MKRISLLILAALCLVGCQRSAYKEPVKAEESVACVAEQASRVTVYAGAVEDYLGQIDDYSWERKNRWEYVMIHFCSAVDRKSVV